MEEVHKKKINWHNIWGSHILTSILTSHMMVTKNPQNVHRNYFWAILLTFIFDIKFDINMCEPHYVNLLFFVNLLHSLHVWLFDIWHLLDNLTSFWHFDTSIKLKPPQPAQGYFFAMLLVVLAANIREKKVSQSHSLSVNRSLLLFVTEVLDTVDYVWNDGTVVFRTCEREKSKLVFQIVSTITPVLSGTCCKRHPVLPSSSKTLELSTV